MKRLLPLLFCSCLGPVAVAQVVNIHQGGVTIAVPAAEVGNMNFTDGTDLTIAGRTYHVADVDSITVTAGEVKPATVGISWAGGRAHVTVAGDVAAALNVTVNGTDVDILAAPDLKKEVNYTLSGTSTDGSFHMDGQYKATLTLDNLTLTNTRGGAITIDNGKRIAVVLPEGTTTTLADGAGGEQKACFYVHGHAEFQGGGTIVVTGNTKHAFDSNEYMQLKKSFGRFVVNSAVGDGLHVGQYFKMGGGEVSISGTKDDGIDVGATDNPDDELNGQVLISGGKLTLDVTADDVKGLKADKQITISGGSITANVSGDGAKGISAGTDLLVNQASGHPTAIKMTVTGTTYKPKDPELESKCRGIKVKGNFTFDGGNISISATGKKAKAISVDGNYTYVSGDIDCKVDAANTK